MTDFETVVANLISNLGINKTRKLLAKSIFFVSTGSNDLFEDFQANPAKNETERCAFVESLVASYQDNLEVSFFIYPSSN